MLTGAEQPKGHTGESAASEAAIVTPQLFLCPRIGASAAIPCYAWPTQQVSGVTVLVVHGLGDHGRALPYVYLAKALGAKGHRVVTFDQRGHGEVKQRERGRARLAGLVEDLETVAQHCRASWARERLCIVGISMGAIVALQGCQQSPGLADSVVAVSAPLGPVAASPLAIGAARLLGNVVPGLPLASGIDLAQVAAEEEALQRYTADPLFHSTVSAGLAADLLAAPDRLRRSAANFCTPILMLHGELDGLAPWDAEFPSRVPPQLLRVRFIPKGRHNLFLDSTRENAFAELDSWLQQGPPQGLISKTMA